MRRRRWRARRGNESVCVCVRERAQRKLNEQFVRDVWRVDAYVRRRQAACRPPPLPSGAAVTAGERAVRGSGRGERMRDRRVARARAQWPSRCGAAAATAARRPFRGGGIRAGCRFAPDAGSRDAARTRQARGQRRAATGRWYTGEREVQQTSQRAHARAPRRGTARLCVLVLLVVVATV